LVAFAAILPVLGTNQTKPAALSSGTQLLTVLLLLPAMLCYAVTACCSSWTRTSTQHRSHHLQLPRQLLHVLSQPLLLLLSWLRHSHQALAS
jgi:hypothetical protein